MDILAENNQCGQVLLKLASRGNTIIAELLRLKDVVPNLYRNPSRADSRKYGELLQLDFNYFKVGNADQEESYERKIESNRQLALADKELKESYSPLLARFYRLFDSIHAYAKDLIYFLDDMENGAFIQVSSLEALFLNEDGKQLLCELLYLYGSMLLLMDLHIEGPVRERLIVAHYRYAGAEANVETICHLLRSTGFSLKSKRPDSYPESYFDRIKIPASYVQLVIGRLRSDDVYNQLLCYQNPEHRSAALAGQAAMLYVCLFFSPATLQNETALMREMVDKFFPDNWVISYYMGTTVNLADVWMGYKAAKAALNNTLHQSNVKKVAAKFKNQLATVLPDIKKTQKDGIITEDTALDQSAKVMNLLKECNVTLKWTMLHTTPLSNGAENSKKCRQLRDLVLQELEFENYAKLFALLTNTAQFEFRFRSIYKNMLDNREENWRLAKAEAVSRLKDLAIIFSGAADSSTAASAAGATSPILQLRVSKSQSLHKWFLDLEKQLEQMSLENHASVSAGTAAQIIEALSSAEYLDRLDANWQVKQLMSETRGLLKQMIRMGAASDDVLVSLQIISDLSYAWGSVIDNFTPIMQQGVKKDPSLVGRLRATFLKLSTAMEEPIMRIGQAKSRDLVSVSQYYSTELVAYVRRVLQIIPESLFKVLDQIVLLQTDKIQEVPTRLDKDQLRDFAQLNDRFEVAKLTHSISTFTEGMLSMKSTLVGVIKVDPKKLLEDGIRKEMVRQVIQFLNDGLIFNPKSKTHELVPKVTTLAKVLSGFRRSFEYISDYVGIAGLGLSVWYFEMARIFNFVVEQESNLLLETKVLAAESCYQSRSVPIPSEDVLGPVPGTDSLTFLGRLAEQVLAMTSPRTVIYVPARSTWYDNKTSGEVAKLTGLIPLLESAIGIYGLVGLDRLFALRASEVVLKRDVIFLADSLIFREKNWIDMLDNLADSLSNGTVMANPNKFYHQQHIQRATKPLTSLSESLVQLGHLQLLRKSIAYHLAFLSSYDSKLLHSALKNLNACVIEEERLDIHKNGSEESKKSSCSDALAFRLASFLSFSGLTDPDKQVYVNAAKPGPRLSELIFLVVIFTLSKLHFSHNAGELIAKRPAEMVMDGHPFVTGVACLLHQYPDEIFDTVMTYMAQYIRSFYVEQTNLARPGPQSLEVTNGITFLERLIGIRKASPDILEKLLPKPLSDLK